MARSIYASAAQSGAGSFATSRRGGLDFAEIDRVRSRLGARATPAQIAKATGRCEADIRVVLVGSEASCVIPARASPLTKPKTHREKLAEKEAAFAVEWRNGTPIETLVARFDMTPGGLQTMVRRLGLKNRVLQRYATVTWTPELDEIVLREFVAGGRPATVVAGMIPGATKSAIISRAWRKGWCRTSSPNPMATPRAHTMAIVDEVAARYGRTVADLRSKRHTRAYAWPRQEAMAALREATDMSFPHIGAFFGSRDHTTVIASIRSYERRRAWCDVVMAFARFA
ncbi:MAG: hypothetical protein DI531_15500 [Brevundimonas sp.]|uniref:helix-turn-helix domain-containing protein n=1 Tax=Brevundimonas sp. TaxID=1871086 RepID=UPI000DB001B8|nr:helix-turn-helix domain-containing protein [Brevundimonas sp.]PZU71668.1 MAG: hypothetical protein DI531_15500 [Brevundimonas sp.]